MNKNEDAIKDEKDTKNNKLDANAAMDLYVFALLYISFLPVFLVDMSTMAHSGGILHPLVHDRSSDVLTSYTRSDRISA